MTTSEIAASLAASVVGGLVVALANHMMMRSREHSQKLTELRIEQLIDCWSKLERGARISEGASLEAKQAAYDGFEQAIARIALLGTGREVEMVERVSERLSNEEPAAVIELLNELRSGLREELGLPMLSDMRDLFFRIRRDKL